MNLKYEQRYLAFCDGEYVFLYLPSSNKDVLLYIKTRSISIDRVFFYGYFSMGIFLWVFFYGYLIDFFIMQIISGRSLRIDNGTVITPKRTYNLLSILKLGGRRIWGWFRVEIGGREG